MKKILIVLILMALSSMVSAQGFKLGAAGNVVFPTGEFSEFNSTGWGVDAFAIFDLIAVTLTARVGYISFGEGDLGEAGELFKTTTTAVPVMVGARWNFGVGVGPSFYAELEAGIHSFSTSAETVGVGGEKESTTEFAFAPVVGVEIAGFDISAYYMIISDANYIGLRVGWGIGI